MDVLQTIHTHGDSRSTQTWNAFPSSQEKVRIKEEIAIDSDDDDVALFKLKQFGSHISTFSFRPEVVSQQSKVTSTSIGSDKMASRAALKVATANRLSPQHALKQEDMSRSSSSSSSSSYSVPIRLPELPDSLVPVLRGFPTCPLCLQPFPLLSATGDIIPKRAMSKKAVAKKAAKSAPNPKTITGAARLTHIQLCAFRKGSSSEVVISLIGREQIRLDRNQRKEYNDEVSKQGIWTTLTGDAPPSTQVQKDSIKARGKQRGKVVVAKPQKGKSSPTKPMAFKAGKRGGLNKATTLIMAPRLTRALVKQRCIELFGLPMSSDEDVKEKALYDDHEETTQRCQQAALSAKSITLGLGVGVCSLKTSDDETGAIARLGMGSTLGTIIAQRYKASG